MRNIRQCAPESIPALIARHQRLFPEAEGQDLVKLLYQREFGPEHMIENPEDALSCLRREMAALPPDGNEPPTFSLGNGLCRLNLRACLFKGLLPETVNRLFVRCAQEHRGSKTRFLDTLAALPAELSGKMPPNEAARTDVFLNDYVKAGCPALHHSERFRLLYHPAYRIVCEEDVPWDR